MNSSTLILSSDKTSSDTARNQTACIKERTECKDR